MKGEGKEVGEKKVTDKRKGRAMSKKSSWGCLSGHYFPVSTLLPAGIRLLGWDRKQSMEVIAMAFPEEQEKTSSSEGSSGVCPKSPVAWSSLEVWPENLIRDETK